jgi:hypothetical protein
MIEAEFAEFAALVAEASLAGRTETALRERIR